MTTVKEIVNDWIESNFPDGVPEKPSLTIVDERLARSVCRSTFSQTRRTYDNAYVGKSYGVVNPIARHIARASLARLVSKGYIRVEGFETVPNAVVDILKTDPEKVEDEDRKKAVKNWYKKAVFYKTPAFAKAWDAYNRAKESVGSLTIRFSTDEGCESVYSFEANLDGVKAAKAVARSRKFKDINPEYYVL